MNDSEFHELYAGMNLPTAFRIIGIGEATKEIIEIVKSCRYDYVSSTVLTEPFECAPTDEDQMVIIVAKNNEDHANSIAKTFHDAGVLTLGLLADANCDCFDSVVSKASWSEYPELIKAILRPLATQGMVAYDFSDLRTTLSDTKHFLIKSATRYGNERMTDALGYIKRTLTSSGLDKIEELSILLYFNREGQHPFVLQEMTAFNDFLGELPASIDVIWAVYHDESINGSEIKVTIIAAGKELDNG